MANKKKNQPVTIGNGTYVLFGTLFGYFLSKARATDYDTIINMFSWKEFQLYGVLGTAILVISLGLFMMRSKKIPVRGSTKPLALESLKWDADRLKGAFLLGAGWALTGTCPGTSLAQLGEGKVVALFTVTGILLGVWAYKKHGPDHSSNEEVC